MPDSRQKPRSSWRVTSGVNDPGTVERLLRMLPGWFGIESALAGYVAAAGELPTYLAWPGDQPAAGQERQPAGQDRQLAGVLLAARHFSRSAEIHLMAVDPAMHRRGAGHALVAAFESDLIADGVQFLQVKTLGPSHPDEGYGRTRAFYASVGFQPLEEIHGLWPENPCLIMIKSLR